MNKIRDHAESLKEELWAFLDSIQIIDPAIRETMNCLLDLLEEIEDPEA